MIDGDDLELFTRSLQHANQTFRGAELDAALAELGWADALDVDPQAAISVQFEQQGRATTVSAALEHLLAISMGQAPMAVVLPAVGGWDAPCVDGVVHGIGRASLSADESVLVVASSAAGTIASVVPVSSLTLTPVEGLDPDLGLALVTGSIEVGSVDVVDWSGAVDRARIALGHELVGLSRTMLDQARTHALDRVQFGQPIAGFQAIRHRLAEALVAIETAEAALEAAWADPSPQLASIAKAVAGRSARTVGKHCQQVMAGIGFTTEHAFHLSLRRALVLDEFFGSARTLTAALGREILASRRLPPLRAL